MHWRVGPLQSLKSEFVASSFGNIEAASTRCLARMRACEEVRRSRSPVSPDHDLPVVAVRRQQPLRSKSGQPGP